MQKLKCFFHLMVERVWEMESISGRRNSHEQWQSDTLVVEMFSIIVGEDSWFHTVHFWAMFIEIKYHST